MKLNPLRQRLLSDPAFSLDKFAHNRGFPNSLAMEAVLRVAVKLKNGNKIGGDDVEKVLKHYDPSMHAVVRETVRRTNDVLDKHGAWHALGALAIAVGGEGSVEGARELIDNYELSDISVGVAEKRNANDHSVEKHREDPNSIRANLLRAAATDMQGMQPTDVLANAAEQAVSKREVLLAVPEAHSLREHVESAFDHHAIGEELEQVADVTEIADGIL